MTEVRRPSVLHKIKDKNIIGLSTMKGWRTLGFDPASPAFERPQTHFIDGATAGIGWEIKFCHLK